MTLSERIANAVAKLADERRESILANPYQFEIRQFVYVIGYDYRLGDALIKQIIVKDSRKEKEVRYVFNKRPRKRAEKEYVVNYSDRLRTPEMPFIFATHREAKEMSDRIKQAIKDVPLG